MEIGLLALIGNFAIYYVILIFLGRYPAIIGSAIWIFLSFHLIAKIPLKFSFISSICLIVANILLFVVLKKH
jgi:hypothetical protein